jgi:transposase
VGIKLKQHSAPTAPPRSSPPKAPPSALAPFGVHPTIISGWKQELATRAGELFARGSKAPAADDAQKVIDDLHRKIDQLQVECDFLAGQPAISRLLRGER